MTNVQKVTLSSSRDIPFNKLILSQSNVRHVKSGVSIEELAEDIARRGLLQGLSVRAVANAEGVETGIYEIPAGGRRFRALQLLVKQKRMTKTTPVPCVVREGGLAEEDSLAENVQRAPLHALDQFRAFLSLREKGQSEEEIAAAFFVPVGVVKQRLRLASVSPKLLDVYAEDGMTLDQLMAFTVSGDHQRQEQVFERLCQSYDKQPYTIRRMLTEGTVRASDKRAQFITVAAYEEAGGVVLNDLFQGDDGGWLQDAGLVDIMVAEKLREAADAVRAEGWKWIEVAPDFAYGHSFGLRQLRGDAVPLTAEEEATLAALSQEADDIEAASAEAEELTEEQDRRMGEIEAAIESINQRPIVFDPADIAMAGAFVSIDRNGRLSVERGFVRAEDEPKVKVEEEPVEDTTAAQPAYGGYGDGGRVAADQNDTTAEVAEPEEDEGIKPLSDRLTTELTAFRTVALRQALGERPDVAFLAALHALALQTFYHYGLDSCLELSVKSVGFSVQAPGLKDSAAAVALDQRHKDWAAALPKQPGELWEALAGFDIDSRQALFAHCIAQGVNAAFDRYTRRPRALAHADQLAHDLDLDVAAAGWTATVDSYLGQVTKARIVGAVREARGDRAAEGIAHLKKGDMAKAAEGLLAGTGWIPEPLRTPGHALPEPVEPAPEAVQVETVEPSEPMDADDPEPTEAEAFEPDFEPAHAFAAE
jgi:ParB family chromosome partitioning protein